jgi:CBS domain-containing protein
MRKFLDRSVIGAGLALLLPTALAAQQLEEVQTIVSAIALGAFALITVAIAVIVYFKPSPSQDRSAVPLRTLLSVANVTHIVQADAFVMDCITMMTERGCDSLLIMNGERLVGIFTDRDALRNVLIPGRDPRSTRICEVMTLDPCCVSPWMTIGAAMELVTERRFKHLPIVEDGKVQAILLRRDLKRWLAEDRVDWAVESGSRRYA